MNQYLNIWEFKIKGNSNRYSFSLGIDSSNKKWINDNLMFPSTFIYGNDPLSAESYDIDMRCEQNIYAWEIDVDKKSCYVTCYALNMDDGTITSTVKKFAENKDGLDIMLILNIKNKSLQIEFEQQKMQTYIYKNTSFMEQYHMAVKICKLNQEILLKEFYIKQRNEN